MQNINPLKLVSLGFAKTVFSNSIGRRGVRMTPTPTPVSPAPSPSKKPKISAELLEPSGEPPKSPTKTGPQLRRFTQFRSPEEREKVEAQNQKLAEGGRGKEGRNKPRNFLTLSIDGNISSGKSTLVASLAEALGAAWTVEGVPEPLQKWVSVGGHNLLALLYQDTPRHNFLFQHYVQLTRLMDTMEPPPPPRPATHGTLRLMERSIQNNRYCFTEMALREGNLHPAEFSVIAEWYGWLEREVELPLDVVVYLRTSPATVYERMRGRGRAEEGGVPLPYLAALHHTYEDWLLGVGPTEGEGPRIHEETPRRFTVLTVDADQDRETVLREATHKVNAFLQNYLREQDQQFQGDGEETPTPTPKGNHSENDAKV